MLSEIGKDPRLLSPDISKSKDLFFIESHKKFTRIKMLASSPPGTFFGGGRAPSAYREAP